jgi:transcriptional regulator with XRE-family HTH domain
MAHTTRYAFKGEARLAVDAGVSKSAVSRLVNGLSSPSFAVMSAIAGALEKHLGRVLDPRELVSFHGRYPTPSACDLCGCRGCSLSKIEQPGIVAGQ